MDGLPEGAIIVDDKRLPTGPSTGTYHNPETGQEHYGLPIDPYSRDHYTKRHRLGHDYSDLKGEERIKAAFGQPLVYGPAPSELKKKWDERELEVEDKTASGAKAEHGNEELVNMVKALAEQVMSLKEEIKESKNDPYSIIEVENKRSEPEYELNTQIPMFE
ncbi:hypothetical protein LCGC14_2090360 [marine sediment metagenome]|uniref:Uncharacterized protein n=1 Tax=marine sediment metagenome TaxID=412755 RepID=A0A0F9ECU3_9ZZZZ